MPVLGEAGGSLEIQACQKRLCFRRAEARLSRQLFMAAGDLAVFLVAVGSIRVFVGLQMGFCCVAPWNQHEVVN